MSLQGWYTLDAFLPTMLPGFHKLFSPWNSTWALGEAKSHLKKKMWEKTLLKRGEKEVQSWFRGAKQNYYMKFNGRNALTSNVLLAGPFPGQIGPFGQHPDLVQQP